jgi:hypothetical protein
VFGVIRELIHQRGPEGEVLAQVGREMSGDPEAPGIAVVGADVGAVGKRERLEAGGEGLGGAGAELERELVDAVFAEGLLPSELPRGPPDRAASVVSALGGWAGLVVPAGSWGLTDRIPTAVGVAPVAALEALLVVLPDGAHERREWKPRGLV